MKRFFIVAGLALIFIVCWSGIKDIIGLIPGTPIHRFGVLLFKNDNPLHPWILSPECERLYAQICAIDYLIIWPISAFVIGWQGASWKLSRRGTAVAAIIGAIMVFSTLLFASYAVYSNISAMAVNIPRTHSLYAYAGYALLLPGLVLVYFASNFGHNRKCAKAQG